MDRRDGLFDVKVVAKYPRNALKSETIINCQLTLPGTDYSKKQETVYYGKQSFLSPFFLCLIQLTELNYSSTTQNKNQLNNPIMIPTRKQISCCPWRQKQDF